MRHTRAFRDKSHRGIHAHVDVQRNFPFSMPDAIIVARFLTGQCPGGGRNLAGGINVRYEHVSPVCEILLVKFLNGGGYCFNFAPSNLTSEVDNSIRTFDALFLSCLTGSRQQSFSGFFILRFKRDSSIRYSSLLSHFFVQASLFLPNAILS